MSIIYFWIVWWIVVLIARRYYRKNLHNRNLYFDDSSFTRKYLMRPLFILGEHYDERNGGRYNNEMPTLMPRYFNGAAARKEGIAAPPDAKLTIHSSGTALRCEICHQSDLFDKVAGFCSRCEHKTI